MRDLSHKGQHVCMPAVDNVSVLLLFYLVNTRMRIKRDIEKRQLCTQGGGGGGGGGGYSSEFSVVVCRPVL